MATKLQLSRLAGGYSETDVVNLERGESYLLELSLEPFAGGSDNGTLYDVEVTTGTSAAAVSCTADSSTDTFTATAHGLSVGDVVWFAASGLPSGISASTNYFVISATANTFRVSSSSGFGSAVNFTTNGTSVTFLKRLPCPGMHLTRVPSAENVVWMIWGAPMTAGVYKPVVRLTYLSAGAVMAQTESVALNLVVHEPMTQPTVTVTDPGTQEVLDQLELEIDILKKQAELEALQAAATVTTMDTAYVSGDYSVEINFDLLTRQLSIPDSDMAEAVPEGEPVTTEVVPLMILSRGERVKLAIGLMKRGVLQDIGTPGTVAVTWKMFEPEAVITLVSGAPTLLGTGEGTRRYSVTAYVDPALVNGVLPRGTGLDRTGVDGYLQIQVTASGGSPLSMISHSAKVKIYRDH